MAASGNRKKIYFFSTISFQNVSSEHSFNDFDVRASMQTGSNARIYNVISVPQITRLLLGDAIISSKTDPHNGSKKEKRKQR